VRARAHRLRTCPSPPHLAHSRLATSSIARDELARAQFSDPTPVETGDKLRLEFPPLARVFPTHGVHVATLHLRAHYPFALDIQTRIAMHAASSLKIPTSGAAALPTKSELTTVIKGPFVHKKSQENFVRKTHKRAIKVFDADRDVLDLWLRYLRKNAMGGVAMKAYVHEYEEYGYGAKEAANLGNMLAGGKVAAAAEEIVKAFGGLEFAEANKVEAPKEEAKVEVETEAVEAAAEVDAAAETKVEEAVEEKTQAEAEPAPAETKDTQA
jgi:small subunit ribosomal protein S10